jgi:lipid-A-disaccharide synthase
LLPGSRLGEIERMLPPFLEAATLVTERIADLALLLPAANAGCRQAIEAQLRRFPALAARVRLLDGQAQAAMIAADVVLLASGTAALEAMLCKRPMVVGHRIAPATYRIVKALGLLKSHYVSLPNVLAGEEVVPELLQDACTPRNLAAAVLQWFEQPEAVAALRPRFRAIHESLRRDASARAADAMVELLAQGTQSDARDAGQRP